MSQSGSHCDNVHGCINAQSPIPSLVQHQYAQSHEQDSWGHTYRFGTKPQSRHYHHSREVGCKRASHPIFPTGHSVLPPPCVAVLAPKLCYARVRLSNSDKAAVSNTALCPQTRFLKSHIITGSNYGDTGSPPGSCIILRSSYQTIR